MSDETTPEEAPLRTAEPFTPSAASDGPFAGLTRWPVAARWSAALGPEGEVGSDDGVAGALAAIQGLEAERAALDARRAEIDREIGERYGEVARAVRRLAVQAGVMPEPSGAYRSREEPTKTAQILAALPGTRAQIAERTGIKPTVVATLLGRLQRDGGPVRKKGDEPAPGAPNRRVTVYDIDVERARGHAGATWALAQRAHDEPPAGGASPAGK